MEENTQELEKLDPLAQALVDSQSKQVAHLAEQINILTQQVGENRKRIDAIYEKLDEFKTEVSRDINAVRTEFTTRLDITNQKIDTEIISVRSEISELRADLTERIDINNQKIDNETKTINQKIDNETKTINQKIDNETNAIRSEISELRADLTERIDITNQRIDITNQKIDNETNTIRSEINELRVELDKRFDTINQKIDKTNERIDGIILQINSQTKWIIGLMATIGLGTLGLVTTVIIKLLFSN